MANPRVIIADEDTDYIKPLQLKFIKEFYQQIDLEIITDKIYFQELFIRPQKAEVLIVSEQLYDPSLQRHNIANIFVMVEQYEVGGTEDLSIHKMFKYTSIKEIFNEIVGKSGNALNIDTNETKETQIVLVTSAAGGTGKTTLAMGLSACLAQNYKRVLYINAGKLQHFQYMLDNTAPISSQEIYAELSNPAEHVYANIKHVIRKEMFNYLPAFKAALMSVGLKYSIYGKVALSAKKSGEYDFIVIDAENTFDEENAKLFDISDKVIVVTEQSVNAVEATNALAANINGANSEKYVFICNKFAKEEYNALISPDMALKFTVNEYIEKFNAGDMISCEEISKKAGIKKLSFLIL